MSVARFVAAAASLCSAAGSEWSRLDAVSTSSASFEGEELYCPPGSCLEGVQRKPHWNAPEADAFLCRYGREDMYGVRPTAWTDLNQRHTIKGVPVVPTTRRCAAGLVPPMCCTLAHADCVACRQRVSVREICQRNAVAFSSGRGHRALAGCATHASVLGAGVGGTSKVSEVVADCGNSMTAADMACRAGVSLREYCIKAVTHRLGIQLEGCQRWLSGGEFHHTWAPTPSPAEREPNPGTSNKCTTQSGPAGEGKNCVFPFKWDGKTHWNCARRDAVTAVRWCATSVDSNGNAVHGAWGNCGKCVAIRNCQGAWQNVGTCSKTCGGGVQVQRYKVVMQANSAGVKCPYTDGASRSLSCGARLCTVPTNCMGHWGKLSPCSKRCGGGLRERAYTVTRIALNGGRQCWPRDGTVQRLKCNTRPCTFDDNGDSVSVWFGGKRPLGAVDCSGAWSSWGECTRTCGGGVKTRTYTVYQPAQGNGLRSTCAKEDGHVQNRWCNTRPCGLAAKRLTPSPTSPVPTPAPTPACVVGRWGQWSFCSKTCGTGFRTRTRHVWSAHAISKCDPGFEVRLCTLQHCITPSSLGTVAKSAPSLEATSERVNVAGMKKREARLERELRAMKSVLRQQLLTVDPEALRACHVSHWGPWSRCSVECGGGLQAQERSILTPGLHSSDCPVLVQTRPCNALPCTAQNLQPLAVEPAAESVIP